MLGSKEFRKIFGPGKDAVCGHYRMFHDEELREVAGHQILLG
jgi:hypothetical protein